MSTLSILLYFVVNAICAVLEQRADALSSWETWLQIHFGLFVPCLGLALAFTFSRSGATRMDRDTLRARYGANRRALVMPRLLKALTLGLLVNLGTLLLCRVLTYPVGIRCFNHDLLTCVGISTLTTITYITFFSAVTKVGAGHVGAIIALLADLTLGHATGSWSALTPHRYVAEMLGTPGIFTIQAYGSSIVLLGISTAATVWITARTHR